MFLLREERPITSHASLDQFQTFWTLWKWFIVAHAIQNPPIPKCFRDPPIAPREGMIPLPPRLLARVLHRFRKLVQLTHASPTKTRESNPLENLRTAPRCGGGGRGKPRRERGDESWTIENRIGGSFCRCRNRWRGFITPVANRNLRAMSFYRKEEARNVRGFCCPRPLLPPSPLFPSFLGGEGKRGEASFIPTRLFSSLLSAPSRAVQKLAFCRDYFARVKPRGKRGREWSGVTRTMRWLERSAGNDAVTRSRERRGASKGLEMAENSTQMPSAPVGKVFEKRAEFHRLGPSGVAQTKEIVALFECFLREPRNRSLEYFLRFGLFDRSFSQDSLFLWKISLP